MHLCSGCALLGTARLPSRLVPPTHLAFGTSSEVMSREAQGVSHMGTLARPNRGSMVMPPGTGRPGGRGNMSPLEERVHAGWTRQERQPTAHPAQHAPPPRPPRRPRRPGCLVASSVIQPNRTQLYPTAVTSRYCSRLRATMSTWYSSTQIWVGGWWWWWWWGFGGGLERDTAGHSRWHDAAQVAAQHGWRAVLCAPLAHPHHRDSTATAVVPGLPPTAGHSRKSSTVVCRKYPGPRPLVRLTRPRLHRVDRLKARWMKSKCATWQAAQRHSSRCVTTCVDQYVRALAEGQGW